MLAALTANGIDQLIFEAPLKAQQVALILQFGPQVNLGNIAHDEVTALETLRRGLRGDTVGRL
ncbi:phosphosulfolactate synthase [Lacticaseibacillus nasuensis]|nr:phosphosulfolactate synthase [Lacticaseibacillus nasuensis]